VTCRNQDEVLELDPKKFTTWTFHRSSLFRLQRASFPFLEHDDANRALMGSNMQRQGVPLLQSDSPFVGTGIEERVAIDSKTVEIADIDGIIAQVDANRIVLTKDGEIPVKAKDIKTDAKKDIFVYDLRKFMRSNAGTCFNQKPIVSRGEPVKKGQILADGASTQDGELAIGRNILVAFHAVEWL
jgi:DNA-directed RNA polymerase subunit beta